MSGLTDAMFVLAYANCEALIEKEKYELNTQLLNEVVYVLLPKEYSNNQLLSFLEWDTIENRMDFLGEYTDQCMACYLCIQKVLTTKQPATASYGKATFILSGKQLLDRLGKSFV